jgi:hypothetical protein
MDNKSSLTKKISFLFMSKVDGLPTSPVEDIKLDLSGFIWNVNEEIFMIIKLGFKNTNYNKYKIVISKK